MHIVTLLDESPSLVDAVGFVEFLCDLVLVCLLSLLFLCVRLIYFFIGFVIVI